MIIHLDMDAFYAAIELRDNPDLIGKPVVVGGSPKGRGVISAASYEARKFGVHSAMSSAQALRQCPDLVFVKPRMEHYAAISKQIREIFFEFTSLVEPIAFDEAFLDVSGCERLFGDAVSIAQQVKQRIRQKTGLIASAGVAPNKFLAKVASDLQKPDGLTVVAPEHVQEFLNPLPISRVWGIGKVTQEKFQALGVYSVADLKKLTEQSMRTQFGVNSQHFWNLARGIDSRPVVPDRNAKSISHETTFSTDIEDVETLRVWILELTDQVARRLRRHKILSRNVQLKIRYSDFRTLSRSSSLQWPTDSSIQLSNVAESVLVDAIAPQNQPRISPGIRLLGVGVTRLSRPVDKTQQLLFDQEVIEKQSRMDRASDQIKDKFGSQAVRRGSSVAKQIHHRSGPLLED